LIKSQPPNSKWWVKISDFGISKRIDAGFMLLSTVPGTTAYMAPEILSQEPGSSYKINYQQADMWSLGEVVFRMLTKMATFPLHSDLFRYMARPDLFPSRPLSENGASDEVDIFIRAIMRPVPDDRLPSAEALRHPWLQPINSTRPRANTSILAEMYCHLHSFLFLIAHLF
jgi:serine/threonine protein kinase